MLSQITARLAEVEGIIEKLKAQDQIEWIQHMNSIRSRAEETVNTELIYALKKQSVFGSLRQITSVFFYDA